MPPNLTIRAAANKRSADVLIYDVIGTGGFFSEEGISAKKLVPQLMALDVQTINVRLNSPGGDVFDGITIYNALVRHPANIHMHVDGLAASAASLIAMAGNTISVASNAMIMIHEAWSIAMGSAADMRATADRLDLGNGSLADTYSKRSGQTVAKVRSMMAEETWMDAETAVALGFADDTTEALLDAACADVAQLRAFGYQHIPQLGRSKPRIASQTIPTAATARPQLDMRAARIQKVKLHLVSRQEQNG